MMNKKIVIGNWKMNPLTFKDAEKLFKEISKRLTGIKNVNLVVCPPLIYLASLKKLSKKIILGAQDSFYGDIGAFTGEVSAEMLYSLGVRYVILGHSERRALGEDNKTINKKIKSALSAGLSPILCVGESSRDENHEYFNFIKQNLEECLKGISKNSLSNIIIAYEPIWAISTTPNQKNATPDDSREMSIFIKKTLSDKFGKESLQMRIIYGGSVNERDALSFFEHGGVDGLLAGKASLHAEKFIAIAKAASVL